MGIGRTERTDGIASRTAVARHLAWRPAALVTALLACIVSLALAGCSLGPEGTTPTITPARQAGAGATASTSTTTSAGTDVPSASSVSGDAFLAALPAATRTELADGYLTLDGNEPSFTAEDATTVAFQSYSPLDALGRCGTAYACLGPETLPTEPRGDIGQVHPSGWQSSHYDFVDGGSLYNRSHLIAFSLSGQNDNERNLVTGTRHMNADVMRPLEEMMLDYIEQTGNHVLYRVTPVFAGSELVARGLQIEALSMEDGGQGVSLNVYLFNTQPGVTIDYATGDNQADGGVTQAGGAKAGDAGRQAGEPAGAAASDARAPAEDDGSRDVEQDFVLNTRSGTFHSPDCPSVSAMSPKNRKDVHASQAQLEADGFSPHAECVG